MHIRKYAQTQGTAMAKLTKAQTVASVRNVLYSYKKKIESVMYDTDKLLPEAQAIVDDYRSDNGIIQNLMKKALDENSSFFEDMDTKVLLQYAQSCYELNTLFDLKAPNLPKITAITEDEKKLVKYRDLTGRSDAGQSTFKVPEGFWNQFTANTMKSFWPTAKNETKCNAFLPFLTKKLGSKVYKDIFPNGEQQADKLDDSFKKNPNLQQIVGTGKTDLDKATSAANQAQELANAGYLVVSALDTTSDGHVSVVGPQSLTYGTYPSQAWEGHTPPGPAQSGNGYGTVLRNYPVFVQAGSYTGVVTPGYAQGRSNLNTNKVLYFLYKPVN